MAQYSEMNTFLKFPFIWSVNIVDAERTDRMVYKSNIFYQAWKVLLVARLVCTCLFFLSRNIVYRWVDVKGNYICEIRCCYCYHHHLFLSCIILRLYMCWQHRTSPWHWWLVTNSEVYWTLMFPLTFLVRLLGV